jgi:hypothetical protein
MSASNIVKVAAVHGAAPFLDLQAGVERTCELILEAGRGGAKLVAFPETYLPGYPHWIWSHTTKYGAPLFAELYHNSIELPSKESKRMGEAARAGGGAGGSVKRRPSLPLPLCGAQCRTPFPQTPPPRPPLTRARGAPTRPRASARAKHRPRWAPYA